MLLTLGTGPQSCKLYGDNKWRWSKHPNFKLSLSFACNHLYTSSFQNCRNFTPHIHFFPGLVGWAFLGGTHRNALISTISLGLLNCEDFICSSTNFGVTHITCWPFQYFTIFIDWRVDIMSVWVILVISLERKMVHALYHDFMGYSLCDNYCFVTSCHNSTICLGSWLSGLQ